MAPSIKLLIILIIITTLILGFAAIVRNQSSDSDNQTNKESQTNSQNSASIDTQKCEADLDCPVIYCTKAPCQVNMCIDGTCRLIKAEEVPNFSSQQINPTDETGSGKVQSPQRCVNGKCLIGNANCEFDYQCE